MLSSDGYKVEHLPPFDPEDLAELDEGRGVAPFPFTLFADIELRPRKNWVDPRRSRRGRAFGSLRLARSAASQSSHKTRAVTSRRAWHGLGSPFGSAECSTSRPSAPGL
jgi:hypothetical protein